MNFGGVALERKRSRNETNMREGDSRLSTRVFPRSRTARDLGHQAEQLLHDGSHRTIE